MQHRMTAVAVQQGQTSCFVNKLTSWQHMRGLKNTLTSILHCSGYLKQSSLQPPPALHIWQES
jgi:hypothetical protein